MNINNHLEITRIVSNPDSDNVYTMNRIDMDRGYKLKLKKMTFKEGFLNVNSGMSVVITQGTSPTYITIDLPAGFVSSFQTVVTHINQTITDNGKEVVFSYDEATQYWSYENTSTSDIARIDFINSLGFFGENLVSKNLNPLETKTGDYSTKALSTIYFLNLNNEIRGECSLSDGTKFYYTTIINIDRFDFTEITQQDVDITIRNDGEDMMIKIINEKGENISLLSSLVLTFNSV
jgi:hypothetical protein